MQNNTFSKLRQKCLTDLGFVSQFQLYENIVKVTDSNEIYINDEKIGSVNTLEEVREYVKKYIENNKLLEDINTSIPEEKLAHYIKQYHNVDKITDTLIESYNELISSNAFTIDPVVTAVKQSRSSEFNNKLIYELDDKSVVAIEEQTQNNLNSLLRDRPEIVNYMKENKYNFIRIVKDLGEN